MKTTPPLKPRYPITEATFKRWVNLKSVQKRKHAYFDCGKCIGAEFISYCYGVRMRYGVESFHHESWLAPERAPEWLVDIVLWHVKKAEASGRHIVRQFKRFRMQPKRAAKARK